MFLTGVDVNMSTFAAFLFRLFNLSPQEAQQESCFKILANSDCVDVEGKALVTVELDTKRNGVIILEKEAAEFPAAPKVGG
ncbi:hypothetical protein QE152_g20010 [Popillia japonica]|uniref:Uncharacterized protein n=1 Tax=Popillia japonica TaxID=7064 RepID=A0AAW1KPF6_POPJA